MCDNIDIRMGKVEDAEAVAQHNVEMAGFDSAMETESLALDRNTVLEGCRAILGDRSKGFYLVATDKERGDVIGQLMITFEWSDWRNKQTWWIQSVYVVPDRRSQGVFRALYAHVRKLCEEDKAAGLRLYADTTNKRAQAVYQGLGMTSHYAVWEDLFC